MKFKGHHIYTKIIFSTKFHQDINIYFLEKIKGTFVEIDLTMTVKSQKLSLDLSKIFNEPEIYKKISFSDITKKLVKSFHPKFDIFLQHLFCSIRNLLDKKKIGIFKKVKTEIGKNIFIIDFTAIVIYLENLKEIKCQRKKGY